jgi:hypothetical protein
MKSKKCALRGCKLTVKPPLMDYCSDQHWKKDRRHLEAQRDRDSKYLGIRGTS